MIRIITVGYTVMFKLRFENTRGYASNVIEVNVRYYAVMGGIIVRGIVVYAGLWLAVLTPAVLLGVVLWTAPDRKRVQIVHCDKVVKAL